MPEQRVNILIYRPDGTLIAQYLLGDGEHLIGRDINCPVYLDSEYISSNHAKLHLSHDGIQIEDLNSTSGTYLDGVTVRGKLRIKPGQVLQVGDLTVQLQPESEGQIGPGSRLGDGRYTLIRMLGRGGMGEVWLAKDEQLDEEVALKKLPPEVGADAMALADMRREVQKSRALSHPNIIRIHDLIQKSGEDPLISLEYVDGTDLTAIAATKTNGVFDWVAIKEWMLQLANALEYAHEEKIVHRDLKPGNIMISRTGRLKLADFGIAATVADSLSRSSMQGFVSGTTLYMSPQQMEGAAPKETDDIYAFGATIYELLTSRPPFYTGNVEHQVLQVTPTPPSQRLEEFGFVGRIPPYVQELVMACLAKVPEGRPQSMGAILDWIKSEGKAEGAIPKPSTKTIKHAAPVAAGGEPAGMAQESGSSGWSPYLVAVVSMIICFVVGILAGGDKKEKQPPKIDDNGSETALGTKKPGTLLWEFATGGGRCYCPAIGTDDTIYVGSDNNKVYALNGRTGTEIWEFVTRGEVKGAPSVGADDTVYIGSKDMKTYALDGATGAKKWEFETDKGMLQRCAIGADGTVYTITGGRAYALNGETGARKWETGEEYGMYNTPAIGADGTVYIGSRNNRIYALDGATGAKKWEFETGGVGGSPAIGTDGTVYVGSRDNKLYALDGATGTKKWEFEVGGWPSSPTIGTDGIIYIGSFDNKIYALDGKAGTKKWTFETGGRVWAPPVIGADGTLYVGSEDQKVYALDGKTGFKQWEFATGEGGVSASLVIGADSTLYVGSRDGKVYAIATTSKGPAKSPWPMFGQNAQHTSRRMN